MLLRLVAEVCDAAERINGGVQDCLTGTETSGKRQTLAALYLHTAFEYHRAVVLLVRSELFGAAFALARPIYEVTMRALWVLHCASEEDVTELCETDCHNRYFGNAEAYIQQIDNNLGTTAFTAHHKEVWESLNSYAHCGLRQLGRRNLGGDQSQGYLTRSTVEILDHSTLCLLVLAQHYLHFMRLGSRVFLLNMLDGAYFSTEMSTGLTVFDGWKEAILRSSGPIGE